MTSIVKSRLQIKPKPVKVSLSNIILIFSMAGKCILNAHSPHVETVCLLMRKEINYRYIHRQYEYPFYICSISWFDSDRNTMWFKMYCGKFKKNKKKLTPGQRNSWYIPTLIREPNLNPSRVNLFIL